MQPGEMDAAAASCTHFNQSLVSVEEKLAWDNENISIDGRLSKDKLISLHSDIQELYDQGGLQWTCWKAGVDELYPELADILQRALNAKYSTQHVEGWQQTSQRATVVLNSDNAAKSSDPVKYNQGHIENKAQER